MRSANEFGPALARFVKRKRKRREREHPFYEIVVINYVKHLSNNYNIKVKVEQKLMDNFIDFLISFGILFNPKTKVST